MLLDSESTSTNVGNSSSCFESVFSGAVTSTNVGKSLDCSCSEELFASSTKVGISSVISFGFSSFAIEEPSLFAAIFVAFTGLFVFC